MATRVLRYGRMQVALIGPVPDAPVFLWRAWIGRQIADFTAPVDAPPLRIIGRALLALRATG